MVYAHGAISCSTLWRLSKIAFAGQLSNSGVRAEWREWSVSLTAIGGFEPF